MNIKFLNLTSCIIIGTSTASRLWSPTHKNGPISIGNDNDLDWFGKYVCCVDFCNGPHGACCKFEPCIPDELEPIRKAESELARELIATIDHPLTLYSDNDFDILGTYSCCVDINESALLYQLPPPMNFQFATSNFCTQTRLFALTSSSSWTINAIAAVLAPKSQAKNLPAG